MQTSRSRILTTHAGSLPRPRELTALHVARARGEAVDAGELTAATDKATRDVVARQIETGLDVVNNGEVGRESFFTYVRHRMSGFGGVSARPLMGDLLRYPDYLARLTRDTGSRESVGLLDAPRAETEVRYTDAEAIRAECAELERALAPHRGRFAEAFVSAPSPGIVAAAMQNAHYPSLEDYVAALARALATEYRAIEAAGFVLQIDAPDLAMERHTLFQDKSLDDFREFVRVVIRALNEALEGIPADRVRLHVCWGNYEGPHDRDVELADILSELARAKVGGFLLSQANPRHAHEYRLLSAAPAGSVLVPGVIDTTTNYVEHPETVALCIERAVSVLGAPERVLAGTDCGFETAAGFATIAPEIAWAKLAALVAGAALASKRLF